MKRILVTGAGGYVGMVLCPHLAAQGYEVVALDRFFFGDHLRVRLDQLEGVTTVKKDVRHIIADDLKGVDVIVDMAALSNDPAGELDQALTYQINRDARQRLGSLAHAAGVSRYVLVSSASVYGGAAGSDALTEADATNPLTTYAASNLEAEAALLALDQPGFSVSVFRNGTLFGLSERMRFDLVVNLMTLHAFSKSQITVLGGGMQSRPLLHVQDFCEALLQLLAKDAASVAGEIFNLSQRNYSVREIAYEVREALPFSIQIVEAPDDDDLRNYRISAEKARSLLGFEAGRTPRDAVLEIYAALKSGATAATPQTKTVGWYRYLLEAKRTLEDVMIDGAILDVGWQPEKD